MNALRGRGIWCCCLRFVRLRFVEEEDGVGIEEVTMAGEVGGEGEGAYIEDARDGDEVGEECDGDGVRMKTSAPVAETLSSLSSSRHSSFVSLVLIEACSK